MISRKSIALPFLLATLLCLPACISGLNSQLPPEQRYTLPVAYADAAASWPEPPASSIQVLRPRAAPGLAGPRIAVLRPGARFDYYAGARWIDDTPAMVQAALIDALRTFGNFATVESDSGPFAAQYLLSCDIRQFQAAYSQAGADPPTVTVDLDCTVGRRSDRSAGGHVSGHGTARAGADRMEAVVEAFGVAASAALRTVAGIAPGAVQ